MLNYEYFFFSECPLLSALLPPDVYCTIDSMCLGIECCINVKLFMHFRSVKVYARLDPDKIDFHFGVDEFQKTISFGRGSMSDGNSFKFIMIQFKKSTVR